MAPMLDSAIIAAITVTLSLGIAVAAVASSHRFLRTVLGREATTPRLAVVTAVWMSAVVAMQVYQSTGLAILEQFIVPVWSVCTLAAALSYCAVLLKSPGGFLGFALSSIIATAELMVVGFGNLISIIGVDMTYVALGGKFQ